ncbi:MAG: hypothetical protein ACM3JD_03365 [Rudaea sp.]
MDRFFSRLPTVETLLWILASITAIAALVILAPAFLATPPAVTPAAAQATGTPRPTLTPFPSSTPLPGVPAYKGRTPVPFPSLPADAQIFTFLADPTQSGWIASGDDKVHWGDRNLHSGVFKEQLYRSVLYFDLTQLPPGSQILAAQVELTGLSRDNLGASGEWRLRLLAPDILTGWASQSPGALGNAAAQADVGEVLHGADLTLGQLNQFIFKQEQLRLVDASLKASGLVAFRIDGPSENGDSLFTWDGAGLNLQAGPHPVLRIAAIPGKFTVITNTPTPQNVLTAAAQLKTLTAFTARYGTATPFPRNYATATPVVYVTAQPTPLNVETRIALALYATAVAQTTGTFTPTPSNWVVITPVPPTSTPGPTPTPIAIPIGRLTPVTTPTIAPPDDVLLATPIPNSVSGVPFKGNILFLSDRFGLSGPVVMQPNGQLLTQFTGMQYYYLAYIRDQYSPDRTRRVWYVTDRFGIQQVAILDVNSGVITPITNLARGLAYDAAWSPDGGRIAYVSTETDNRDEIYIYDLGTRTSRRLTDNSIYAPFTPWLKHPSFSPDGRQIAYKSNRITGHYQIWIMNSDGSGMYNASNSQWEDTDPVWVKGP